MQHASEARRKKIFLALVEAQDGGASVEESRKIIAGGLGRARTRSGGLSRKGWRRTGPRYARTSLQARSELPLLAGLLINFSSSRPYTRT
jgi:hypothetical protein